MTMPLSIGGATASQALSPTAGGSERAQLSEAAKQFEAIFLRQMLAAARKTDFGGHEVFGGQGEATFNEMRDARFAELAAGTGTLGMAEAIEAQLARFVGPGG